MRWLILYIFLMIPQLSLAIPCDCSIEVSPPISGSLLSEVKLLKVLEVEEFSQYSRKNIFLCRKSCLVEFQEKYLGDKLNQDLRGYTSELVEAKKIGTSCAFPVELKYPVKMKAFLGEKKLGVVEDTIEFVRYESNCF